MIFRGKKLSLHKIRRHFRIYNNNNMFLDKTSLEELLNLLVVPHPHLMLDVRLLKAIFNRCFNAIFCLNFPLFCP